MSCHSVQETEDALGDYDCQVDGKKLTGASAYVLHSGMEAAGLPEDAGMSQTHLDVNNVSCVDDQNASGGADAIYVCSYTAAH